MLRSGLTIGADDAQGPAPLILTLRFDPARQAFFDALRAAHFPPARNVLKAHATLFHKLPGDALDAVVARLEEAAAATPAPRVDVQGPYPLGGGVAYRLDAPDVLALRRRLAEGWADRLSPQDKAWNRLHVTVQNKADAAEARRLHAALAAAFEPQAFVSPGLALWRYLGGPWAPVARFDFGG